MYTQLDTKRTNIETKHLVSQMAMKVVGQEDAVTTLLNLVEMYRAGFCAPRRPAGNALFLGPTGSGKTRVIEALAESLFGNARACIKIDCAEFQHSHEVAKLIGSPPGYLGHRETQPVLTQEALNQFHTEKLKLNIVLFDEIEKASDALWSLLLGILDKAVLTLGDNRKVDFSQSIIVLTSNLGAQQMQQEINGRIGFQKAAEAEVVEQAKLDAIARAAAKSKFTPEFMNRLQHINVFHTLTPEHLEKVLDLELDTLKNYIIAHAAVKVFFNVTKSAKKRILAEGFDPKYNARYLQRTITRLITQPLAQLASSGQVKDTDVVLIQDTGKETLDFYLEDRPSASNIPLWRLA